MNKKELAALEAIWIREISGTLPFQSKAKIYHDLADKGMCFQDTETRHFKDLLPPMKITGWYLTHPGRFEYCSSCGGDD